MNLLKLPARSMAAGAEPWSLPIPHPPTPTPTPLPNEWENTFSPTLIKAEQQFVRAIIEELHFFLFIDVLIRAGRWATGVFQLAG